MLRKPDWHLAPSGRSTDERNTNPRAPSIIKILLTKEPHEQLLLSYAIPSASPAVAHLHVSPNRDPFQTPREGVKKDTSQNGNQTHILLILALKNFHNTAAYPTKQSPFPNTTCVPNPHQKNPK